MFKNSGLYAVISMKKLLGLAAANLIQDNMLVGLGTGSTANCFIESLALRVERGLQIKAIASSSESEDLAKKNGITVLNIEDIIKIDFTVDGADCVDPNKNLIKGLGGALLKEKMLARYSTEMIVIIEEHKLVKNFYKTKLPVEITPFGVNLTKSEIEALGYPAQVRKNQDGSVFITENQNLILDLYLETILLNPEELHAILLNIPGVVETGLFCNYANQIIIADQNANIKFIN